MTAAPSKATPRTLWILGLLSLSLFAGLAIDLAALEPGVLALQLAFTPQAFAWVVHQWSAADLQRYRAHLPVDYILLLTYGAFGLLFARWVRAMQAASPWVRRAATWALPVAALCDAGENALHAWLTAMPRFGVAPLYAVSGSLALLKWLLIIAFALMVAHAWLKARA